MPRHVPDRDDRSSLGSLFVTRRHDTIAVDATLGAKIPGGSDTPDEPFPKLDRYVIEAVLGKGGMGIVYAAQDTMLARRVALKLIRPELDGTDSDARTRLLREAQAMARLTHAHVVTVHDVGMFEEQLFVAMELVDGTTLRNWLERKERPWREVLAAFIQAGRGLEAAHAVDLVHRDFKPENVLRGTDGRVRVTDFGLSHLAIESSEPVKLAQGTSASSGEPFTRITISGLLLGTPAYMSPEQYVGVRTDARTDQFSFCVALYEALYGEHPFGGDTLAELAERVLGPVRKQPPKSTPVPERVRKAILRGLSTAPDDRHPSMRELLHELEAAQAPRRRKRALMLAGASLLTMGALWARHPRAQPCSGASSRLAGSWSEQTRSAVTAAILTSGSAHAADAAARATTALDAYATAWRASSTESCQSTERHEQSQTLLDLRAACLNERLEEFTTLTRILQQNAAEVTSRSISAVLALTPVSSCAPGALLTTERLPDSTAQRAQIAQVRTYIAEAKAFSDAGLYPQSLERATQSVQMAASTGYQPAVAESLLRQGLSEHKVGRSLVSTVTLARALDAAERAGLDELRMLAAIELLKANTHASRFDEAEKFAAVAAAISDRLHQPPLLEVDRLDAICLLRLSQEKFGEAQASCAGALARLQSLAQPPDDRLARELSALGNAELRLGHVEAAIADEKRALGILERSLGPDNSNVAEQLDEVGSMLAFAGRYAEADALQSRAVAIAEKTFSAEHPAHGVILENYARTLFYQKKWDEAEKMRRRALQIFERSEPYPGYRAHVLMGLGEISLAQHKLDQASRELEQAEPLAQQANGPDSFEVSSVRDLLGRVERERGKFAAAIAFHERVYASVTKIVGKDHPDVSVCLFNLGEDYLAAGAGGRAVESFTRALAIDERATDGSVAQRLVGDRARLAKARLLASTQAAR